MDFVSLFAESKNFRISPRNIFVEGTTDVDIFVLASRLEYEATGTDLLGTKISIISAGDGDEGGAKGICRELVSFKNLARNCLLPNGKPRYRFIGLFDNDQAGRQAITYIKKVDTSIIEFSDVYRLWPEMPICPNQGPDALAKRIHEENKPYKGLDWELEDHFSETLIDGFMSEYPDCRYRISEQNGRIHRDWRRNDKARLIKFARDYAMRDDVLPVINVLKALRRYLGYSLE